MITAKRWGLLFAAAGVAAVLGAVGSSAQASLQHRRSVLAPTERTTDDPR